MSKPLVNPGRRQWVLASALAGVGLDAVAGNEQPPQLPASRQPGLTLKPGARRMRIAFGSCARQEKPQPIWQAIAAVHPDLFVFLGDNFYADAQSEATLRQRYREFREFRETAPLQAFRRATPHVAIWDDHDFGDDDVGGEYAHKKLSQQLFCDEWGEPAESPRRTRSGIYESYRFEAGGRNVQLIMLDLRYNRTALIVDPALKQDYRMMVLKAKLTGAPMTGWYVPNADPKASMLGEAQWAWLEQQLHEPADVRIIGSSVQFAADGTGWEGWANFPLERQRFVDLLKKTRAEGAFMISGDMHYADISRWPVSDGYPLWDITSSGLTEVWDIPTPNRQRVSAVLAEQNFGLVDLDWSGGSLDIKLSICDVHGQVKLSQALRQDQLRFGENLSAKAGKS
ncbi:alkaline phosphatase D family protein [Roseateles koreensis]|uniref:Alkaline phosphatase D family protein n=1 Tax=Roseateles koreensis TaxID=2987526 RepID=A0ABT5KPG4_9BURK|nr:alkaline phosphatase D family protein [Roseateles koreensis]MDC8784345.1 alkaline phosphatase D family protein [Roseateles koreensis]